VKRIRLKGLSAWKGGVIPLALALAGCASTPPPLEEIASSTTAIDLAEQAGAHDHAPIELASAHKKLRQARMAMANEDYDAARWLAEEAQVEAELAQAKSQSALTQQSLMQVRESIRVLREEIGEGVSVETTPP
jgi:hypothetical protein